MHPFPRFLLVLTLATLVLFLCGGPLFAPFSMFGAAFGLVWGVLGAIAGVVAGLFFGLLGLVAGAVAIVPLLIPLLILFSPVLLVIGIVVLLTRAAARA